MWKIKDPDAVKALINQLLSDDEISKSCNDQMYDGSSYILLFNDDEQIQLRLDKERFEKVPEYDPKADEILDRDRADLIEAWEPISTLDFTVKYVN